MQNMLFFVINNATQSNNGGMDSNGPSQATTYDYSEHVNDG